MQKEELDLCSDGWMWAEAGWGTEKPQSDQTFSASRSAALGYLHAQTPRSASGEEPTGIAAHPGGHMTEVLSPPPCRRGRHPAVYFLCPPE